MITVLVPYRDRDITRVLYSLDSLKSQSNSNFNVKFIDYGSSNEYSTKIQSILKRFSFVEYYYLHTSNQPWNKSKALNFILKRLESEYFLVSDVDMIFHPNFIENCFHLLKNNPVWYFKVGYLNQEESKLKKPFDQYKIDYESNVGDTGITLCRVRLAKQIRGFDEFYHFWGSEDSDFHKRIKLEGARVEQYVERILVLHQWHISYRINESNQLSRKLQIRGIVRYNHRYLSHTNERNLDSVNMYGWGNMQTEQEAIALDTIKKENILSIALDLNEINYFLFQLLPQLENGIHHFSFGKSKEKKNLKSWLKIPFVYSNKKILTLKEVNDRLLFHVINLYHHNPYMYKINKDMDIIRFSIIIKEMQR